MQCFISVSATSKFDNNIGELFMIISDVPDYHDTHYCCTGYLTCSLYSDHEISWSTLEINFIFPYIHISSI